MLTTRVIKRALLFRSFASYVDFLYGSLKEVDAFYEAQIGTYTHLRTYETLNPALKPIVSEFLQKSVSERGKVIGFLDTLEYIKKNKILNIKKMKGDSENPESPLCDFKLDEINALVDLTSQMGPCVVFEDLHGFNMLIQDFESIMRSFNQIRMEQECMVEVVAVMPEYRDGKVQLPCLFTYTETKVAKDARLPNDDRDDILSKTQLELLGNVRKACESFDNIHVRTTNGVVHVGDIREMANFTYESIRDLVSVMYIELGKKEIVKP